MQNYRESVHATMNSILGVLYSKISSIGTRTKSYFDPLFAAYFEGRRIIQDKLDRLSSHSSAGYAIVLMVKFAAMVLMQGVQVECVYHSRPYYWMMLKLLIYLLYNIVRETTRAFAVIGAILKLFVIMVFGLTSTICVGLTMGVFHLLKLLITAVTSLVVILCNDWKLCFLCLVVTMLMLLWRRNEVSTRYCWQFSKTDSYQWSNFGPSDNVAIEKLYCDVENLQVNVILKDTTNSLRGLNASSITVTINFEQMSMQCDTSAQFLLCRRSTPSYVQEPGNRLSTKWIWYWKDDNGWKKYAETNQSTGTKQEDIEAAYLKEERIYFFQNGTSKYIIPFYETSMYQRNMDPRYLTTRSVRRRPLFVSQPKLQITQSVLTGEKMDFERIALGYDSREYQAASKHFHATISVDDAKILVIEKIKNDFLLERFNRKREQMKKKLKASSYDKMEKLLFHGTTSDVIEAICKQNFDHRMRGKNGTVYGEGSYFAVNASYSNNYSGQSGERFMFLASVLTGEYKLGGPDLRRPPLKDPSNPASDLYDSCVDNEQHPKIFVIFNDEQCYPLYLIKYR